tara:strand:+ start:109 stop:900 length:792 start_codon:yes stop_codon:yes gene_type:complete
MSKTNTNLKTIIEKGAEIGGSLSSAVISLAVAAPLGAIVGAIAGPLISSAFSYVGNEISDKFLSPRESSRIGATYSLAYDNINRKIEKGETIRDDDFFTSSDGERSSAETLLEGALLSVRNEYEEKKIKYYANFISNLNFDKTISYEKGNVLLKIIEQLSYRQLITIAYFRKIGLLDTNNWSISFQNKESLNSYNDFYYEIMELYNIKLLKEKEGISMMVRTLKLSSFGEIMFNLLELDKIEDDDISIINQIISEINVLVKNN